MNRSDALKTPSGVLANRRELAYRALANGTMLLPAAVIQYQSRDGERRYHPDRELFYLTGVTEPGSVAVLSGSESTFILFVRDKDPAAELWSGPRLGPELAVDRFQPDECYPLSELGDRLPLLLQRSDRLYWRLGRGGEVEPHIMAALAQTHLKGSRTGSGPRGVVDPGEVLDKLRMTKDAHELTLIKHAVEMTIEGHKVGAGKIAPGVGEWEIEAAINAAFRCAGGGGPGYGTIVGSGVNACVLHYVDNDDMIAKDSLVLVDAGAEYGLYNADVTRTYPSGGRFTQPQREIYELVDTARRAAIDFIAPGVSIAEVHDTATQILVDGLVGLRVLEGDPAELISEGKHKFFYPHQTSHWLGLDVHDPGDYARDGKSQILEPGMVVTVEPGLYFRPGQPKTPDAFEGIGIRIEDDVLVTAEGREVLTASLPSESSEVERLIKA